MIEVREKLVNASTGDVRPGNLLPVKLGDSIEQITVDNNTIQVKYYYVQTPDKEWRKTQYYELVDNLHTITYKINDTDYAVYYLLEGDVVTIPEYNMETGYSWSGWLSQPPAVMPAYDIVINSTLEHISFNLVYFVDNRVVYFETHFYNDVLTEYVPESKSGYTFSGWTGFPEADEETEESYMPAHDVIVTGTYTANDTYTLTYMIDSSVYATAQYNAGDAVRSAAEPDEIENGYTWSGWINEPSVMPANDFTVTSSLTPNQYALDYYVDSSLWKSINYDYKASIVSETYTPPTGKQFSGWLNEPETMPAIDHYMVTGKTGYNFHDITFMLDASTIYASYKLAQGDQIPQIEIQKDGYVFLGWNPEVPQFMPDSSILTYAQLSNTDCVVNWYTINNNDKSTAQLLTTQNYIYGETLIIPEYPERIGWDSSVIIEGELKVFSDRDCYINYNRLTYQIYYYVDETLLDTACYEFDASVDLTVSASKRGYTFTGWDPQIPSRMPRYDISTYAQFDINSYNIYYYVDSSCILSETYEYNEQILLAQDPVKEGYVFKNWQPAVPVRMPNHDIITSAQFNKISYVYWYIDSSIVASGLYEAGEMVISPVSEYDYIYDWNGNDTFIMGTMDVSIYGQKRYFDTSLFGVAIEQYHESINNPQIDLGYYDVAFDSDMNMYHDYRDLKTDSNLYGFVYPLRHIDYPEEQDHQHGTIEYNTYNIYSYWYIISEGIPAIFGYQVSSDGVNWTDTNNIQFDTDISNKFMDANGIIHMPEISSYKFIRLALKSINGELTAEQKEQTEYFGIRIGRIDFIRTENDTDDNDINSILLMDNTQNGCRFQTFGVFDSLYSHLEEQLNENFDTNCHVHGLRLSLVNNVCHSHHTFEYSAHNFIRGNQTIETAPVIRATDLFYKCYQGRFSNSIRLTNPPQLPATTLARGCYLYMFANCNSLTKTPNLPATSLAAHCYEFMFVNCNSLTETPELPATTLVHNCYRGMFNGCSSLTKVSQLSAESVPIYAYREMFANCSSLLIPPVISGKYFYDFSCVEMFSGCVNLRNRAVLDITTASVGFDAGMYNGCTSLQD